MVFKFCTFNQKSSEAWKKSLTLRYPPPAPCTQAAEQSKKSFFVFSFVFSAADPCISPPSVLYWGGKEKSLKWGEMPRGEGRDCHLWDTNRGTKGAAMPLRSWGGLHKQKLPAVYSVHFLYLRKLGKARRLVYLPG